MELLMTMLQTLVCPTIHLQLGQEHFGFMPFWRALVQNEMQKKKKKKKTPPGFGFLFHDINFIGLFNAKAILVEDDSGTI